MKHFTLNISIDRFNIETNIKPITIHVKQNTYYIYCYGKVFSAETKWQELILNQNTSYPDGEYLAAITCIELSYCKIIRSTIPTHVGYYCKTNNTFFFSTNLNRLIDLLAFKPRLNEEWIIESLSYFGSSSENCPYNEVYRLPSSHTLIYKKGTIQINKYWELIQSPEYTKDDYIENFRYLISGSIQARLENVKNIGIEMSGGLDSTGIFKLINSFSEKHTIYTFSQVLGENKEFKSNDDRILIDKFLEPHKNIAGKHYIHGDGQQLFSDLNFIQLITGYNLQENYTTFSIPLFLKASEKNNDVLFSGWGGDQMVTSHNTRYKIELASRLKFIELFKINQTPYEFIKFLYQLIKSYKRFNKTFVDGFYDNLLISKKYIDKYEVKERFKEINKNIFTKNYKVYLKNRFTFNLINQRVENSSIILNHLGIHNTYPLFDRKLVEFYYSLPANLYFKDGENRAIFKESLKDLLPKELLTYKKSRIPTIPTWKYRLINSKSEFIEINQTIQKAGVLDNVIDFNKLNYWLNNISNLNKYQYKLLINTISLFVFLKEYYDIK